MHEKKAFKVIDEGDENKLQTRVLYAFNAGQIHSQFQLSFYHIRLKAIKAHERKISMSNFQSLSVWQEKRHELPFVNFLYEEKRE